MNHETPREDQGQPSEDRWASFPIEKGGDRKQKPVKLTFNQIAFQIEHGATVPHPFDDFRNGNDDSQAGDDKQG